MRYWVKITDKLYLFFHLLHLHDVLLIQNSQYLLHIYCTFTNAQSNAIFKVLFLTFLMPDEIIAFKKSLVGWVKKKKTSASTAV